jgi:hypothetical protein
VKELGVLVDDVDVDVDVEVIVFACVRENRHRRAERMTDRIVSDLN